MCYRHGQIETGEVLTRKDYDGGVDAKYSLTPSLTLDATYRTDFAQVEVDQQQVNLTRFSLFFPEKRDFFLENTSNFGFGPSSFGRTSFGRSRRIGLSATGDPIPIIGGMRVSGRVNQSHSLFQPPDRFKRYRRPHSDHWGHACVGKSEPIRHRFLSNENRAAGLHTIQ